MTEERVLRILLADDEKPIVNIYKKGLPRQFAAHDNSEFSDLDSELFGNERDNGPAAEITVCQQGTEAVKLALEADAAGQPFDVVVLDIRMPPGIDGVQAAKQIRGDSPGIPIIFVSGYSDYTADELRQLVPPPGPLRYLSKPVQLQQLAAVIRQVTVADAADG